MHTYTHALKQFAAFIVGDSCDGINKLLEKFLDSQLDGDDLCFDVVAVLLGVSVFIYTYIHIHTYYTHVYTYILVIFCFKALNETLAYIQTVHTCIHTYMHTYIHTYVHY